jgi:hypothetical protein
VLDNLLEERLADPVSRRRLAHYASAYMLDRSEQTADVGEKDMYRRVARILEVFSEGEVDEHNVGGTEHGLDGLCDL